MTQNIVSEQRAGTKAPGQAKERQINAGMGKVNSKCEKIIKNFIEAP